MRRFLLILHFFLLCEKNTVAQSSASPPLLDSLMASQPAHFQRILSNPEQYEVQIIYSQINRGPANQATLTEYTYHLRPDRYYNPASLVKLPTAALALEKLNEIIVPGVNKFAPIAYDSSHACQTKTKVRFPLAQSYPCVAAFIEKMLLVSDNDAYSRLYEFLGQGYIQQKLKSKNYQQARIVRRFADCDSTENRYTNPVLFYNQDGKVIYQQEAAYHAQPYLPPLGIVKKGKSYLTDEWQVISKPKDYTYSNYLSLHDIHQMLVSIMLPEGISKNQRFHLNPEDYRFLRKCLASYPREAYWTNYPPTKGYFDTYKKYLYYGRKSQQVNPHLRIFNIVGWWDGYLTDVAYFVDFEKKIEFFLSAVIYVNENQRFDYHFEYESIGFPFLKNLGKLIYDYEKNRSRKFLPDLSDYQLFDQP